MIWVLDTNIISELRRSKPNRAVLDWIAKQDANSIWTSRMCLVEIQSGITVQSDPQRQKLLQDWYDEAVLPMFDGKVYDVDEDTLKNWLSNLRLAKESQSAAPPVDFLIAATCLAKKSGVVTRDVAPFIACGLHTLNPFTGERFNRPLTLE